MRTFISITVGLEDSVPRYKSLGYLLNGERVDGGNPCHRGDLRSPAKPQAWDKRVGVGLGNVEGQSWRRATMGSRLAARTAG